MIGQRVMNAQRLVLLIESDGRQYAWEVIDPGEVSWEFSGMTRHGGTQAKVTAAGTFHRITKDAEPMFDEIGPPIMELEEQDDE